MLFNYSTTFLYFFSDCNRYFFPIFIFSDIFSIAIPLRVYSFRDLINPSLYYIHTESGTQSITLDIFINVMP